MSPRRRDLGAVVALLSGALVWGLIWLPYRILERAGLDGVSASALTYLAALAITLLLLPRALTEIVRAPRVAAAIALAAGWTNLTYVLAILDGHVARVVMLFYIAPLWTLGLAWLVLGERPTRSGIAVMVCALLGAVLTLSPHAGGTPTPRADWLALSAGFGFALTNVLTRRATHLGMGAKIAAPALGVVLLSAAWLAFGGSAIGATTAALASPHIVGLVCAIGLALAATAATVQYGVTHLAANRAILIMLSEIVIAAGSAAWFADEYPRALELAGAALIVSATILTARAERPQRRLPAESGGLLDSARQSR